MSLKKGDLEGCILPEISIDEFEPKEGKSEDVIVVAFYLTDEPPADDLNTFIQRGVIDTMDVEASPNTDEEGHYLVFVEMARNNTFPEKFKALVRDVENVSGDIKWRIRTYFSNGKTFSIDDPDLYKYMILTPADYVPKDEFMIKDLKEDIYKFFGNSLITGLTVLENVVIITSNRTKIIAEVVDVGDYDDVIGRHFLSESAFRVGENPYEAKMLMNMLGDCQILPLGKYLCINRDDRVMLIKNTQIKYGN